MSVLEVPRRLAARPMLGGAVGSFAARGVGAVLMLAAQVLIAREAGPDQAGWFALAFAVVSIVAVVGRLGVDGAILRDAARARADAVDHDAVARSGGRVAGVGLTVGAVALAALAGPISTLVGQPSARTALAVGALAVVPIGLVVVHGEAIKGVGHAVNGTVVQAVVNAAATLALVLLVPTGTAALAMGLVAAGAAVAMAAGWIEWRRWVPRTRGSAIRWRATLRGASPFLGASVAQLVLLWAPVLAVARWGAPSDVAGYFAADRWTQASSAALVAVNAVVGPRVAAMWSEGDVASVRRLSQRATRASVLVAAAIAAVMIAGAVPLLDLFGDSYGDAVPAMRWLALGQFVVLALGPVTTVAAMTGGERTVRTAGFVAAAVDVVLLAVLVPAHGLVGAGIATAIALAVNKIPIAVILTKRLSRP